MIARIWRGITLAEKADAYIDYLNETGLKAYAETPGNRGVQVLRRLQGLPGFGEEKSRIFLAFLGKQRGVAPAGWREAVAPFGEPGTTRSVADITDKASLLEVRATKKAIKAAARG